MTVTWLTDAGPLGHRVDALSFSVDDMSGLFIAAFYPNGTDQLIYESGLFRPSFSQSTVVVGTAPAATFTLIRTGGWPDDTTIKVYAAGGGTVYTSAVINDTGIAGSGATDKDCLIYLNSRISNLTLDQIGPAFAINSFARTSGNLIVQRGASLTALAATASYTSTPGSATVTNTLAGSTNVSDVAPGAWSGVSPFTSWAMAGTVQCFGASGGADPTMQVLLSATGATTKTSSYTYTWTDPVYWGVSALNLVTGADILANLTAQLQTGRSYTFSVNPTAAYLYYAVSTARGLVPSFVVNGFPGTYFNSPSTVTVTNALGAVNSYYLYKGLYTVTGSYTVVPG